MEAGAEPPPPRGKRPPDVTNSTGDPERIYSRFRVHGVIDFRRWDRAHWRPGPGWRGETSHLVHVVPLAPVTQEHML